MKETSTASRFDYVELYRRYEQLAADDGEFRSQMGKRVGAPDELRERPAFYRLFPGQRPPESAERVAFVLPWCRHAADAPSVGHQIAEAGVAGKRGERMMQVYRAEYPNDVVMLRRLLIRMQKPPVDWARLGRTLSFWDDSDKRALLEDFFIRLNPNAR